MILIRLKNKNLINSKERETGSSNFRFAKTFSTFKYENAQLNENGNRKTCECFK